MEERLHQLESEVEKLRSTIQHEVHFSEKEFTSRIEDYIFDKKEHGKVRVSILEISQDLNIPIEHVDRVMQKLSAKGIREVI